MLGLISWSRIYWGILFVRWQWLCFAYGTSIMRIADLLDIACMKLDAIASRGTKRDFVDLYFICQDKKNNLNSLMRLYQKKYEIKNMFHLLKSLTYFVDADEHEMPKMLKPCKWDEVKFFFESKVKKIVLPRPKVARVK